MKNIHVLPTDKSSRLHFDCKLFLSTNPQISREINSIVEGRNIYITSDEEIKEGDWCLDLMNNTIYVATKVVVHNLKSLEYEQYLKKIILTTDQDLIKDDVRAINNEFLEWFVKNPSCEVVEVDSWSDDLDGYWLRKYKIIIPSEEPQQETLEEAAERLYPHCGNALREMAKETFINGAKWQEKEIIEELFDWLTTNNYLTDLKETLIKDFNQFKNK